MTNNRIRFNYLDANDAQVGAANEIRCDMLACFAAMQQFIIQHRILNAKQ